MSGAAEGLASIAEKLDELPDRLAALLGGQNSGGSARSSAGTKKPSAFDALGSYGVIEDTYGLKEDAGKQSQNPPKAPWGDEPDVYKTQPKEQSQDPVDAWRGKFKLPGTSLSLGSMAADFMGSARQVGKANDQWNEAADWTPSSGRKTMPRQNQEADASDQQDRQSSQGNDETSRKLVEVIEQLRQALDKNTDALDRQASSGDGGGSGPGLGEILSLAKMAGS